MSAKTEKLLSVNVVVDHDCGNYRIGEVDFSISGGVTEFLKKYGIYGRNDLILKLDYLSYYVRNEYEKLDNHGESHETAKSK